MCAVSSVSEFPQFIDIEESPNSLDCEGCIQCQMGSKLVLFITGNCHWRCDYCPLSETRRDIDFMYANERPCNDFDEVIEEARAMRATGAGITGGDPLMAKERSLEGIRRLKREFGDDFHINPEEIEKKYFGVLTKLFNVARFTSQFDVPEDLEAPPASLAPEDRWILAEFQNTMHTVETAWSNLDIYTATQALKTFGTGLLPSHYLEMVKSRLYDEDEAAAWTLHRIVRDFMAAFSPVCPFFTHHISSTVYGTSSVDVDVFPSAPLSELAVGTDEGGRLCGLSHALQEFNGQTWAKKKDAGISLNQPIAGLSVPEELAEFSATLTRMHKLE